MKGLDTTLENPEGKTPGEYMESRIVMTGREVGVHEAWEGFATRLTAPQLETKATGAAIVGTTALDLGENEQCERRWKVPGANPITTSSAPLDSG